MFNTSACVFSRKEVPFVVCMMQRMFRGQNPQEGNFGKKKENLQNNWLSISLKLNSIVTEFEYRHDVNKETSWVVQSCLTISQDGGESPF